MLVNRTYYFLKPILPWRVRVLLRQWRARPRRRIFAGTWPIDHRASRTPVGWPGWPDGKKFAIILTHDVEGALGRDRCLQLMRLEQSAGFRSAFNLIPAGSYDVPAALR